MEKDKLMELINSIVDERKSIENEIKKQTENKVLCGFNLMKQCLEYANEMQPYFAKMNCIPRSVYICNGDVYRPVRWFYGNNNKFGFSYECFGNFYIYLENINEEYVNCCLKSFSCNASVMAQLLVTNGYTFEKFKTDLNEMLANEIMQYKAKNNTMKVGA